MLVDECAPSSPSVRCPHAVDAAGYETPNRGRFAHTANFDCSFDPIPREIPMVREHLEQWLRIEGIDPEVAYDALVVASELATNGVLHDGGGQIRLQARRIGHELLLKVHSIDLTDGSVFRRHREIDEWTSHGRGMTLVAELTEEHSVEVDGDRRTVACRISLG